ncbi:DsbA family protein [Aggregatilinea lenta]|uniref:DsbA family protein n=1 Tax=Aggregatilinea lenta TaxID=913108 RepID=UPI0013C3716E|nr:thioredoxin domain-containing protein [Aggregatilinea lenta]
MIRHRALGLAAGLVLLASLLAGPIAAHAQSSTNLSQSYTWEAYATTVNYPADWIAVPTDTTVSIHPSDVDVTDGNGPEMVLFALPGVGADQLDTTASTYAGSINGRSGALKTGTVGGYLSRSFTFAQTNPSASGGVTLVALDGGTAIGFAYIVRSADASAYLPVLQAIGGSITFGGTPSVQDATPAPPEQEPTARTMQSFESSYGYAIDYPLDWTMDATSTPGDLTLYPADADLSANDGPEFVVLILDLPGSDVDEVLDLIIGNRPGTFTAPEPGQIDGHDTRLVTYSDPERDPAQNGGIYIVQVDADTFLAAGYRATEADFDTYLDEFEMIRDSIQFPEGGATSQTTTTGISQSVASVQLEQRFDWSEGDITLYVPAGWQIYTGRDAGEDYFSATPPLELESGDFNFQFIQGSTFPLDAWEDLREVAADLASGYSGDAVITDITVAGYPAVLYEVVDDTESPAVHLLYVVIDLQSDGRGLFFNLGADVDQWAAFRPTADSVIASMDRLDNDLSRFFSSFTTTSTHPLRADAYWIGPDTPVPSRQGDDSRPFIWEEFGITATLPAGWTAVEGGEDFDLAFVSPEAQATGEGAFITVRYFATLGPGITLDAALASVAEQIGGEVESTTLAGNDSYTVNFVESGAAHHLILAPYGEVGESMYFQTSAPETDDAAVQAVLDSLTFDPPLPDYALIDAAWQQSLTGSQQLIYGDADAPVQMMEFLEMSCPHCADYTLGVNRLMALEVEPGQLRVEVVPMVFNGNEATSGLATQAIYCATEQGKGYTAYEAIYASYRDLSASVAYTRDQIAATLGSEDVGVDIDAINQCLDDGTYDALLGTNNQRANDYGVTGTPGVLFATDGDFEFLELPSGETWTGGVPISVVRLVIDQINDGESLSDMFVNVSPTATESSEDASTTPGATEAATDAATSMDTSSGTGARDMLVGAARQATEEAEEAIVVEVTQAVTEVAAAASTSDDEAAAKTTTEEDDSNTATIAAVAGGVVLLALVGVGFTVMSRRQAAPVPNPVGAGPSYEDDDTLDVSNDDTI